MNRHITQINRLIKNRPGESEQLLAEYCRHNNLMHESFVIKNGTAKLKER